MAPTITRTFCRHFSRQMTFAKAFLFTLLLFSTVSAQWWPHCWDGRRAIVHLFEWRWDDIAAECERFLAPNSYCGVQVSPPTECRIVDNQWEVRPWSERYNPVSYRTYSRSGDEPALIDMVRRCNDVGVRVYVDAVFNHMTSVYAGHDYGVGGSEFDAGQLWYPEVPYNASHFNTKPKCPTASGNIEDWDDAVQNRNCRLIDMNDLDQSQSWVRDRIVNWLNKLVGFGVAGFRIDAAKHMWPSDLQAIFGRLDNLPSKWFLAQARPFIYQEVIQGGQISASEYYHLGRITEFSFGNHLTSVFKNGIQLKTLRNFGQDWGMMPDGSALVFVDNHDTQRDGHVLNFFDPRPYKMAVTFMLAWPYGFARVMSSYWWQRYYVNGQDQNKWHGPPTDANYNIKAVKLNPDGTCADGWTCEHRWRQIYQMVHFRGVVGDSAGVGNWWDDWNNQIAFSRGNRGFFAMNGDRAGKNMDVWLSTGMSGGYYCDVISGHRSDDKKSCTGKSVKVEADGRTNVKIDAYADDPMIAIHLESKLDL